MINSRAKGKSAELEFAKLLGERLGVSVIRNLDQSRSGGHDLSAPGEDSRSRALNRYAIEVKRRAKVSPALVVAFWAQAEAQAAKAGKVPVLAVRGDRQPWRVVVPLSVIHASFASVSGIEWTATLSVAAFCAIVEYASRQ